MAWPSPPVTDEAVGAWRGRSHGQEGLSWPLDLLCPSLPAGPAGLDGAGSFTLSSHLPSCVLPSHFFDCVPVTHPFHR